MSGAGVSGAGVSGAGVNRVDPPARSSASNPRVAAPFRVVAVPAALALGSVGGIAAQHAHFPHNGQPVVEVDTDSIPGLSAPGDSLLLCPNPNPQQKSCGKGSVSWIVSAPAGSTLYFFCAIHAWMQGVIHVT